LDDRKGHPYYTTVQLQLPFDVREVRIGDASVRTPRLRPLPLRGEGACACYLYLRKLFPCGYILCLYKIANR